MMYIDEKKGVIVFDKLTRPDHNLIGATKPVITILPEHMRSSQKVALQEALELGMQSAKRSRKIFSS